MNSLSKPGFGNTENSEEMINSTSDSCDYDSWLSMRGVTDGERDGYIVREWHDGREQQLSTPASRLENGKWNEPQGDYKPVLSPDGKHIAFFRRYSARYDLSQPYNTRHESWVAGYRTSIIVMDADGSNVRELVSPTYMNTNPMWTRKKYINSSGEEEYRVMWTRMYPMFPNLPRLPAGFHPEAPLKMQFCWADIDNIQGQEQCISHPWWPSIFVYSGLKDGRILIRLEGINQLALLTPNADKSKKPKVEPIIFADSLIRGISNPFKLYHKISISPDEKKIAYMKVFPSYPGQATLASSYTKAVLAYADFDASTNTIANEKIITNFDPTTIQWYPVFTRNNKKIIYGHNGYPGVTPAGQIYEYDIQTGKTKRISLHKDGFYRYPMPWGSIK